jgi:hypothetical protein
MARFGLKRDIKFFQSISRELVDAVVSNTVVLYKLILGDVKTNLYGESLSKSYYDGIEVQAMIERGETEVVYEGFGADTNQRVQFRFNRFSLDEVGFFPEIGDLIFHNNGYFEIDNVNEDQLIAGRTDDGQRFSIVCSTFMTRRSGVQTEERNI